MDAAEIARRIRLGEDSRTEFKCWLRGKRKDNVAAIARALTAFANSGGGTVFVGVEDDGTVSGVGSGKESEEAMRAVQQASRSLIEPPIRFDVEKAEHDGKVLLLLTVPGFLPSRPFQSGGYWVRDGNETRQATSSELRTLLQSVDYHFDVAPVKGSSAADFDPSFVATFLSRLNGRPVDAENERAQLEALGCLDASGVPTVTGILLLAKDPQRWFVDARVSVVRFAGPSVASDVTASREFRGRVTEQIEEAAAFLAGLVPSPSDVEGVRRVARGIPDTVLREALANAVCHRDYTFASQVRVFVFPGFVEFWNPGGLLNAMTIESIKLRGKTQRRNPVLAEVVARYLNGRENWGIGVPQMIDLMRARGLPEPVFEIVSGDFHVVLQNPPTSAAP